MSDLILKSQVLKPARRSDLSSQIAFWNWTMEMKQIITAAKSRSTYAVNPAR